jgi:hypothetical protein
MELFALFREIKHYKKGWAWNSNDEWERNKGKEVTSVNSFSSM